MGKIAQFGQSVGALFKRAFAEAASMARLAREALWNLIEDIWHGSVTWVWFSVLLVGAIAMASVGEFGGGLSVAVLAFVSLASRYWHWATNKKGILSKSRAIVWPLLVGVSALSYFVVNDMRGSAPWSHLPKAWSEMLIASDVRFQPFPPREWGVPEPPVIEYPDPLHSPKPVEHLPALKPEVKLRFVHTDVPALLIINSSEAVARDIKWGAILWNRSNPTENDPVQIPVATFDWIKGSGVGGPQSIFDRVASQVKPGDVLYGSAFVDCPDCSRGHTYFVLITYGAGGWFAEIPNATTGGPALPLRLDQATRDAYFAIIQNVPEDQRLPITPQ